MPRDSVYVGFLFGFHAGDAARRTLRQCGLHQEAAESEQRDGRQGGTHSGMHVRLAPDDPRLPVLLERLRHQNVYTTTFYDRRYSKRELDRAPWLWLNVGTAGVTGGSAVGQPHTYRNACNECGAGALPEPPLIAHLSKVSPKGIDHTSYDGHLIVLTRIADALARGGVSGFTPLPVRSPRSWPSEKYVWLHIDSVLPPMSDLSSGLLAEKRCPSCGRAGYGMSHTAPFVPYFECLPANAPDLNRTWEHFGEFEYQKRPRPLPGEQLVIASQLVRQVLLLAGLRRLRWTPIASRPIESVSLSSTATS